LAAEVQTVYDAGARVIHCDVMDGHFVPPITFGPMVVAHLREALPADAFLDVHLMIERPERHIVDFVKAGAGNVTFHYEATPHVDYTMNLIREAGAQAGVAINPGTSTDIFAVQPDLALCMTVNPGWGGQPFIERSIDRIRALQKRVGPDTAIQVDGGVDVRTAGACARAGATSFVAGSAIFGKEDPAQAYREIAAAAGCG
jgi:ribulose-phosphate 3-epimerase